MTHKAGGMREEIASVAGADSQAVGAVMRAEEVVREARETVGRLWAERGLVPLPYSDEMTVAVRAYIEGRIAGVAWAQERVLA